MPPSEAEALSVGQLEQILQAADPAVVLVAPRILRRAIRALGGGAYAGLHVPHRKSFVCQKAQLLSVAEPHELGLRSDSPIEGPLVLLSRPSEGALAVAPRGELLRKYWRLLFHTRIHRAFLAPDGRPRLTDAELRDRLRHLGRAEFEEIQFVLRQEQFLMNPADDRAAYEEFAAVFFEIRYFVPWLLPLYFPGLQDWERVQELLARDVCAASLFDATRLRGASEPTGDDEPVSRADEESAAASVPPSVAAPSEDLCDRLLIQSARAAQVGNLVRTVLLASRAERCATTEAAARARATARDALDSLTRRLQAALRLGPEEAMAWREILPTLQEPALNGVWSPEARFLYDLQKVCLDHERTVYAVDLVEWAVSFGKRPIKRPLPGQPEVLALKHLRAALKRLTTLAISDDGRRRLAGLLSDAIARAEERVRALFRPMIREALDGVALHPENFPEQVAREKLIEELLDRVIEHGFLTMGELRDAISRNQLKLPDLNGFQELLHGDQLIRTNRRLAVTLDGVYHRGEVYLRGLQRLSSTGFGTRPGRILTRYLALPFGGAFFALMGTQLIVEEVAGLFTGEHPEGMHLMNPYSFVGLGLFLFAVLHLPSFRRGLSMGFRAVARGGRWLLFDLPAAALRLPLVDRFVTSRPFRWCARYVLKPAAYALPASLAFPLLGAGALTWSAGGLVLLALMSGLLNSRWGRNLEEVLQDNSLRIWRQVYLDLLPGLFWFVVGLFRRAVEAMERGLYSVDEWLRFRSGDSRVSLVAKAVLGVGWFFLTYVIRVFINLFVEPTFNPIKHFPVVTVAAKLIFPVLPQLTKALMNPLVPVLGKAVAGSVAGLGVFFLPGLAGFLVWEFKENWRLYQANRPKSLRPVIIGHHGETLPRLLRPGFHSGTLPKLFAKLRKARRRAQRTGRWKAFRKQRNAFHHVEESVRHFLEREFLSFVNSSHGWDGAPVTIREIALSTNQVCVELSCPAIAPEVARLSFWEHERALTARVDRPGWLSRLSPSQTAVFAAALAGAYKLSGVDVIDGRFVQEQRNFKAIDISWHDWVESWELFEAGKEQTPGWLDGFVVMPNQPAVSRTAPDAREGDGR